MAISVNGSRPFRKKTSQPSCSKKDALLSDSDKYSTPLTLQQEEKEIEDFINQTVMIFHQLSDVWPFHWQQQIDELGWMRYCLTWEEREQLKSLGLQNLLNTSWTKPDPCCSGPGRWKKT